MRLVYSCFKYLLFAFGIVPIVIACSTSTIEYYKAPAEYGLMYNYSNVWYTFFYRYYWLTLIYYSYLFLGGLFLLRGLIWYIAIINEKQEVIPNKFWLYIYLFLYQFLVMKIGNFTTGYFHYGNRNYTLVLHLLFTSAIFIFVYDWLLRYPKITQMKQEGS